MRHRVRSVQQAQQITRHTLGLQSIRASSLVKRSGLLFQTFLFEIHTDFGTTYRVAFLYTAGFGRLKLLLRHLGPARGREQRTYQ